MVLAGRWEVMDRMLDGRWSHIGEPAFDAAVTQALEQAVQVAGSGGAYVELLTAPCFDSGEQPNGLPWPEDDPARLARYNQLVREVAAEHPATVRVLDFDSMVCPGGVYTTSIDGVQLRDGDGVHIVPTAAAGPVAGRPPAARRGPGRVGTRWPDAAWPRPRPRRPPHSPRPDGVGLGSAVRRRARAAPDGRGAADQPAAGVRRGRGSG